MIPPHHQRKTIRQQLRRVKIRILTRHLAMPSSGVAAAQPGNDLMRDTSLSVALTMGYSRWKFAQHTGIRRNATDGTQATVTWPRRCSRRSRKS